MSTGFVPSSVSTVCVTRQPWAAAKSRHFVLAGERAQGFGLHASSGIGGLAVLLRQGAVHGSALASGDRKTSAVAALAGGVTRDEVVRILGFLEGEHRLFAQLQYGTGMRISEGLQLRVKDLDFDHGTIIVRRAGPGSGLDVTRELGTQPARAAVACTGMVAEGPGRGPQRRCAFPTPLSGSIRARAFLAVVLGFCAAHAFDRSTERCRASPSHA